MRITISTPCHGDINPAVTHAMAMQVVPGLLMAGHAVYWDIEDRDPNQTRARSVLLQRFVDSGADAQICMDRDTLATAEDFLALLAVEEDVLGSLCRPKLLNQDWVGEPVEPAVSRGALREMNRIGFGLVKITRAAALKMTEAAPQSFVARTGASAGKRVANVFRTEVRDDEFVSCDFVFSEQWRELGGRLWVHTGVKVGHVGTHVFR